MRMDTKFSELLNGIEKSAKNLKEKSKDIAVQLADQNNDGQFDMKDVAFMIKSASDVAKKGAQSLSEIADEKSRELELKNLKPIFLETLDSIDFTMPKLIRITEREKKYAESEVCKGSVGYWYEQKGSRLLNVFRDSVDAFWLEFYPYVDYGFYYIDPTDSDHYIA